VLCNLADTYWIWGGNAGNGDGIDLVFRDGHGQGGPELATPSRRGLPPTAPDGTSGKLETQPLPGLVHGFGAENQVLPFFSSCSGSQYPDQVRYGRIFVHFLNAEIYLHATWNDRGYEMVKASSAHGITV
jgi:hypothetical protein